MQNILQLGTMLMVGLITFGALLLTEKNKYIVLDMIFLGFILTTYEWISENTIKVSMIGFQIGISDFLCIYLLLCTILFKNKIQLIRGIRGIWYIVLVVFIIGIVRGLANNLLNLVIEDIRRLVWAFIVPVGCMRILPFSFDDRKTVHRVSNYCKIIVIFCFVCWVMDLILGIHIVSAQSDAKTTMRVLRPEQALVMAMFAIKSVYDDLNSKDKKISVGSIILIIVVILLQHRSAWVSLVVGLTYLVIVARIDSGKSKKLLTSKKFVFQICGLIIICIGVLFALRNTSLMQQFMKGLYGLVGDKGTTFNYRQQLWTAHFATLNSTEWVIGKPFGSGYYINFTTYGREITPHSAYVHTILRSGIIGIVCVVFYILSVLRASRKNCFGAGEAICIMLLVFFYVYTYNFFTAVILGSVVRTICERYQEVQHELL